MSVEARTTGTCPACEQPIRVGDPICTDPMDGGRKSWIHVTCPPEPAPRHVCPVCWMTLALNGACACPPE